MELQEHMIKDKVAISLQITDFVFSLTFTS